ncbi:hypothetical protein C9374_005910 [Naegleria lovaniensis]|uniref:Uncharacterized protein n=1 Tax=Naegleria lovaniensis TaxID=51637 RepID=A0AA88GPC8_NAELO|nr:uncharacterized protein C9374_005910 [Naegleria lovaniensis]KAG2382118.1 hypothetical protein C9374_005910 [Naegleria lovaniensis]
MIVRSNLNAHVICLILSRLHHTENSTEAISLITNFLSHTQNIDFLSVYSTQAENTNSPLTSVPTTTTPTKHENSFMLACTLQYCKECLNEMIHRMNKDPTLKLDLDYVKQLLKPLQEFDVFLWLTTKQVVQKQLSMSSQEHINSSQEPQYQQNSSSIPFPSHVMTRQQGPTLLPHLLNMSKMKQMEHDSLLKEIHQQTTLIPQLLSMSERYQKDQLEKKEKEIESLTEMLSEATTRSNLLEQALVDMEKTLHKQQQEFLTQIEKQQIEIETLKKNLHNKESEFDHATVLNNSHENSKIQLEHQVESLSQELQIVKESLNCARNENEKLTCQHHDTVKELEEHTNIATQQIQELTKEKDSLAHAMNELRHTLHEKEELIKYQESLYKQLQEKVISTTIELISKTKDHEHCQQQVVRLEKELDHLTESKEKLSKEKQQLSEEVKNINGNLNAKSIELTELNEKLEKVKSMLKEAYTTQSNLKTNFEKEKQELLSKVENLEEEKNKLASMNELYEKSKNMLKDAFIKESKLKSDFEQEKQTLLKRINTLEQELKNTPKSAPPSIQVDTVPTVPHTSATANIEEGLSPALSEASSVTSTKSYVFVQELEDLLDSVEDGSVTDLEFSAVYCDFKDLDRQQLIDVGEVIEISSHLKSLDISNKGCDDASAKTIFSALTKNERITSVDMSNNTLIGDGSLPELCNLLEKNKKLQSLKLMGTSFSADGTRNILSSLLTNFSLHTFNLNIYCLNEDEKAKFKNHLKNNNKH